MRLDKKLSQLALNLLQNIFYKQKQQNDKNESQYESLDGLSSNNFFFVFVFFSSWWHVQQS